MLFFNGLTWGITFCCKDVFKGLCIVLFVRARDNFKGDFLDFFDFLDFLDFLDLVLDGGVK